MSSGNETPSAAIFAGDRFVFASFDFADTDILAVSIAYICNQTFHVRPVRFYSFSYHTVNASLKPFLGKPDLRVRWRWA